MTASEDHSKRAAVVGPTDWSLVLAAARDKLGGEALNTLCTIYWPAIYGAVRRRGLPPAESEDITQAFFAELLEKKWIEKAQPERGRFRGFLGTLLWNFVRNYRRIEGAQKRNGLGPNLSIDVERCEVSLKALSENLDPAQTLDRMWADCLIETVLEKLANEYAAGGSPGYFTTYSPFLMQRSQDGEYGALEKTLGLNRGQAAKNVHKLKKRYLLLLRSEVARTLEDPRDVDDELRHLLRAVAR